DAEMVHLIGATTSNAMWKQLTTVKEVRGVLRVMTTWQQLYQMHVEEGVDILAHISTAQQLQEELHLMGHIVEDTEFSNILISSLPCHDYVAPKSNSNTGSLSMITFNYPTERSLEKYRTYLGFTSD
ncbi:hypothetical protein FRB97_004434, partial [Tulasnella sp. 331]